MPENREAAERAVRDDERERCARIAEAFTASDWIAYDMRSGSFPKQSAPGVAIAAKLRATRPAAEPAGVSEAMLDVAQEAYRVELRRLMGLSRTTSGMLRECLRTALTAALATEEGERHDER